MLLALKAERATSRAQSQVNLGLPGPRIGTVLQNELEFSVKQLSEFQPAGSFLSSS